MKKLSFVILLSFALVMLFGGVAYANFGPHGGYEKDTDSCAGCHRAHTSFSPVTWTDQGGNQHSALLVSSAQTMEEFCYACHGDDAPGASTNVSSGVFDGGPSGTEGQALGATNQGVQVAYRTNSAFNGTLNGGGFDRMWNGTGYSPATSKHNMDDPLYDPMWGNGNSVTDAGSELLLFTCVDCHDPHGSANYRILKDSVNGNTVGGYDATGEVPDPWVVSNEQGYPIAGWLKHDAGAAQMVGYRPNYTSPEYGYLAGATDERSISGWCAGCHEQYIDSTGADGSNAAANTYDYGPYEASGFFRSDDVTSVVGTATIGARARHRHPVNITLAAGVGPLRALAAEVITDAVIPLEARNPGVEPRRDWDFSDYLGCLTCHRAHGTSVTMTGWAEAKYVSNPSAVVTWYPERLTQEITAGVNPNFTSALLRANNRGVCERCHNK